MPIPLSRLIAVGRRVRFDASLSAECSMGSLALVRVTISDKHIAIILRADASGANQKLDFATARERDDGVELSIGIRLKQRQTAILIEAPCASQHAPRVDRALVRALPTASNRQSPTVVDFLHLRNTLEVATPS